MDKREFKGLKKYEPLLKTICKMEEYDQLPESEWEGCLGIACVISVIEGVSPNIFALSKHLNIPPQNESLKRAFDRLRVNSVFGNKRDIKNDPSLTGKSKSKEWQTNVEIERNAWCWLAGVSGGFVGIKEIEENK